MVISRLGIYSQVFLDRHPGKPQTRDRRDFTMAAGPSEDYLDDDYDTSHAINVPKYRGMTFTLHQIHLIVLFVSNLNHLVSF